MKRQYWLRQFPGAVMRQTITRVNVDIYLCRDIASLGHNEDTILQSVAIWLFIILTHIISYLFFAAFLCVYDWYSEMHAVNRCLHEARCALL